MVAEAIAVLTADVYSKPLPGGAGGASATLLRSRVLVFSLVLILAELSAVRCSWRSRLELFTSMEVESGRQSMFSNRPEMDSSTPLPSSLGATDVLDRLMARGAAPPSSRAQLMSASVGRKKPVVTANPLGGEGGGAKGGGGEGGGTLGGE